MIVTYTDGISLAGIVTNKICFMDILESFNQKVAYHSQRPNRIEGLSDGVFAIVMTLLVLDVRLPPEVMNSENGIWFSLVHTIPRILTFILSFSVVGLFWTIFNNQFNYINDSDRNLIIIAIFYLLFISLLPFSTSFLSEYLWSRVAIGFYILNILLIILMATIHWVYAYHAGMIQMQGEKNTVIHKAMMRRVRTAFIGYGVVAACCFFSSYLAISATILLQVIFTFIGFADFFDRGLGKKIKELDKCEA